MLFLFFSSATTLPVCILYLANGSSVPSVVLTRERKNFPTGKLIHCQSQHSKKRSQVLTGHRYSNQESRNLRLIRFVDLSMTGKRNVVSHPSKNSFHLNNNNNNNPFEGTMATNQYDDLVVPRLLLEGLALDTSILQSLLKRHRCNHGRTLYYRRMEMALKSIRRSEVLESVPYMNTTFTDRVRTYQQSQRKQQQKRQRYETKTRLKQEEQWSLERSETKRQNDKNNADGMNEDPLQLIWTDLRGLIKIWTIKSEEIISRIHHAAKMLFAEVSRGFFLPFCSVALASIARIRAMLMEIGRLCLSHLYNVQNELLTENENRKNTHIEMCLKESQFCRYMGIYMEGDEPTVTLAARIGNNNGTIPDVNETLTILGIPRPSPSSSSSKNKNNNSKKRKATNEKSLDFKKGTNEKTIQKKLQRKEDTDEMISMDMESTTFAAAEKFQDDKDMEEEEKDKQQDIKVKSGTMAQKSSYSVSDVKSPGSSDDEEEGDDKRLSSTEMKDKDNELNNANEDSDINALFRTSSNSQQEKDDTPKTTRKKRKKEKKTKKKKKKQSSSSAEDSFFDQLFS